MLRYVVTLMLYAVEEAETFISEKLVQCAFEYISTKPSPSLGCGTGVESSDHLWDC